MDKRAFFIKLHFKIASKYGLAGGDVALIRIRKYTPKTFREFITDRLTIHLKQLQLDIHKLKVRETDKPSAANSTSITGLKEEIKHLTTSVKKKIATLNALKKLEPGAWEDINQVTEYDVGARPITVTGS